MKKYCSKSLDLLNVKINEIKFPIKRLTYDQALKELNAKAVKLNWGDDLTPEAEKKLCEIYPCVIITKWPCKIKPFYAMKEPDNPSHGRIEEIYDEKYGPREAHPVRAIGNVSKHDGGHTEQNYQYECENNNPSK